MTTEPAEQDTHEDESYSRGSMELIAAIVQSNVDQASRTTNFLLENLRQQRDDAMMNFIEMYDTLAMIPDNIRSVAIDRLLGLNAFSYDHYKSTLSREDENAS